MGQLLNKWIPKIHATSAREASLNTALAPNLRVISNCNLQRSRLLPGLKSIDACLSLHRVQKHWLSRELDELKQQSIDATDLWKSFGMSRSV